MMYIALLMRTIATTTAIVWSFPTRALNICPIVAVCMSTVDFSRIFAQVRAINTTNKMAMIIVKYLKPTRSSICAPAPSPANFTPSAWTLIIVIIVIIAEPTPAQERASVVRPSRSLPPSVNAGIIDQ